MDEEEAEMSAAAAAEAAAAGVVVQPGSRRHEFPGAEPDEAFLMSDMLRQAWEKNASMTDGGWARRRRASGGGGVPRCCCSSPLS